MGLFFKYKVFGNLQYFKKLVLMEANFEIKLLKSSIFPFLSFS